MAILMLSFKKKQKNNLAASRNNLSFLPTRSDTNRAVNSLKLKISDRDCAIYVAKTKALISRAVTVQQICVIVFAYAKIRFSYDTTQL